MGERIISVRKVVYSKESFDVSVDTSGWVSNPHPPPPTPLSYPDVLSSSSNDPHSPDYI